MATYYVWSGATGSATGADWTNAFTTFAAGVAAATAASDVILVHVGHVENLSADTTFGFNNSVFVFCVDKDNQNALAEQNGSTQYIGHDSLSRSITLTCGAVYDVYVHGLAFRMSTSGTTDHLHFGSGSGDQLTLVKCMFYLEAYLGTARIRLGSLVGNNEVLVRCRECVFSFGHHLQTIEAHTGVIQLLSCTVARTGGTGLNALFSPASSDASGFVTVDGCDLSVVDGSLVGSHTSGNKRYIFNQCKLNASVSPLAAQSIAAQHVEVFVHDCSGTTNHYEFGYFNPAGQVIAEPSVYVTASGAEYNSTGSKLSWKIVGTSVASKQTPFLTPWLSVYNETLSAMTPYVEALRSGSTTKYTDNQLWSEWMYKASTSTLGTIISERTADVTGAGADLAASSLGASDWTGEHASDNAFMKLESGSITPGAIGDISVRFGVVGAITVYIDPQIRGLS